MAGEYPFETIEAAARATKAAGYRSFWLSQPPDRDSLRTLALISGQTDTIELGVGAIPLTARAAEEIAAVVNALGLPLPRLRLGIGSGIGPGALDRLRDGIRELKQRLDVHVVVAPLGPKMCRVAGEVGDSVLLNWLVPEFARVSRQWIGEGAEAAGRMPPLACTYVRCALGESSRARLEQDCARYGAFPHYAAHFRRQGIEPIEATILARTGAELQDRLADYEAELDQVIVRAITPADAVDETLALLEAARPQT